jgi:hypothetical protein
MVIRKRENVAMAVVSEVKRIRFPVSLDTAFIAASLSSFKVLDDDKGDKARYATET